MSKGRLHKIEPDNLISNLRAEVGEIIESWVLMREFYVIANQLQTPDLQKDISNQELNKVYRIRKKFQDDIISRLSELGYKNYGQINFHIASEKFSCYHDEVSEFVKFLKANKFQARRNEYISHKKLFKTWDDHRAEYRITYKTIVKGIAHALSLMKKFDVKFYGEEIKESWHEMRKLRGDFSMPASSKYLMLPYLHKKPRI